MISPALRRAVQPACAACSISAQSTTRPSTLSPVTASCSTLSRPLHQRRHSSSKPSSPADGDSKAVPTPSTTAAPKDAAPSKPVAKKSGGRASRKKFTTPTINVPKVAPTHYLNPRDVQISAWFAMHRPISVTTPIPQTASPATFNSIFEPKANGVFDVMHTLSDAVESLEAAGQFREEVDVTDSMMHVSGNPGSAPVTTVEIDRLLAQCVPFRPPPPPVAVEEQARQRKASGKKRSQAERPSKQKSWTMNVNLTQSTLPNGKSSWTVVASDPQEVDVPTMGEETSSYTIRQPFLNRMRARHLRFREHLRKQRGVQKPKMQLISVKRQRKLKMKKHKYKKLMKRTRTERRKLGQV